MKVQTHGLVLTMLVLIVGACQQKTPINRLQEWDKSMSRSVVQARNWCIERIKTIKQEVKKSGNPEIGLEYIERAEALDKRTLEVLGEIDKLRLQMMMDAGGGLDKTTHLVKKPFEVERMKKVMSKQWPKLKTLLTSYARFINDNSKDLQGLKINCDFFVLDEEFKGMDFYQLYFEEATAEQAIMSLIAIQIQIINYESSVLAKFGFDGSPL